MTASSPRWKCFRKWSDSRTNWEGSWNGQWIWIPTSRMKLIMRIILLIFKKIFPVNPPRLPFRQGQQGSLRSPRKKRIFLPSNLSLQKVPPRRPGLREAPRLSVTKRNMAGLSLLYCCLSFLLIFGNGKQDQRPRF